MRLGEDEAEVGAGDCVVIPPGTPHKLWNPGAEPLVLLCCCAPPTRDDDTVMTGAVELLRGLTRIERVGARRRRAC